MFIRKEGSKSNTNHTSGDADGVRSCPVTFVILIIVRTPSNRWGLGEGNNPFFKHITG